MIRKQGSLLIVVPEDFLNTNIPRHKVKTEGVIFRPETNFSFTLDPNDGIWEPNLGFHLPRGNSEYSIFLVCDEIVDLARVFPKNLVLPMRFTEEDNLKNAMTEYLLSRIEALEICLELPEVTARLLFSGISEVYTAHIPIAGLKAKKPMDRFITEVSAS